MKYGIAIFPSKKLQDLANSYRKRYDPNYALIPPHITLKDAFTSDLEGEAITEKIQAVAEKYEPFTMKVIKVSSFQPVNNTIYFKIDSNPVLEGLNKDLTDIFPNEEPKYSFVPHITIGQNLSHAEHSDVFGQLRMLGIDHEEEVDRFHLLYQLENGSWTVYETFRLGKEQQ